MRLLDKSTEIAPESYRMYVVISYLTYLGIAVHALLCPLFFWMGLPVLGAFNILSIAAWVSARYINQRGRHSLAAVVLLVEVCLHTVLAVYYIGWAAGFQYYLMAAIPFTMFMFDSRVRIGNLLIASGAICMLFVMLYTFSLHHAYVHAHLVTVQSMQYLNAVIAFLGLTIISYYFRAASLVSEREMEALANTDQLTGLTNRRGIQPLLETHYKLFMRDRADFCLILADIDHFKRVNDTYGHDCGDQVLKVVAGILRHQVRQSDTKARWGGEEFLLMLPDTELKAALDIAENIRARVERQLFRFNGHEFHISMTLGVAQQEWGRSVEDTIKLADNLLYLGKRNGRNQVQCAQPFDRENIPLRAVPVGNLANN